MYIDISFNTYSDLCKYVFEYIKDKRILYITSKPFPIKQYIRYINRGCEFMQCTDNLNICIVHNIMHLSFMLEYQIEEYIIMHKPQSIFIDCLDTLLHTDRYSIVNTLNTSRKYSLINDIPFIFLSLKSKKGLWYKYLMNKCIIK